MGYSLVNVFRGYVVMADSSVLHPDLCKKCLPLDFAAVVEGTSVVIGERIVVVGSAADIQGPTT